MKSLLTPLFCLIYSFVIAQNSYDLIVTGSFSPSTVEVGETSEYQLEVCNFTLTGSTIPSGAESLTVVIGSGALPDAASPPTGNFGSNFNWTFIAPNIWYGVSTAAMPFGCGYMVNIPVTATAISNNASNYDGNIMSPDSDSQPANDTGSARLLVNALLPVEFTDVNVSNKDCKTAELNWATATEVNNDGFIIQRKTDLSDEFIDIDFVEGENFAGAEYVYNDNLKDLPSRVKYLYYRLEQRDFDGNSVYSKVVTTSFNCDTKLTIDGYPNPAIDTYTFSVSGLTGIADLKIHNIHGEAVKKMKVEDNAKLTIDLSTLVAGTYSVGLYSTEGALLQTQRLIKLNN